MKVEYVNHMGDDLQIVNSARVSFGKRSEWLPAGSKTDPDGTNSQVISGKPVVLSKQDQGLIQFLARGCTSGDWDELVMEAYDAVLASGSKGSYNYKTFAKIEETLNHVRRMPSHWSPFAHTAITLHLKMPIFVARQIMKHTTGLEYNEVSRRYVDSEPEFYVPDVWRKKADNVKQGSSDEEATHVTWDIGDGEQGGVLRVVAEDHNQYALDLYNAMLNCQVAPEQARMVLPQSMYTEVIATGNLYAWANLYIQRTDSHAQKETRDLAKQIGEIIQPLYPVSWEALTA